MSQLAQAPAFVDNDYQHAWCAEFANARKGRMLRAVSGREIWF
jgi:hypothetical protein